MPKREMRNTLINQLKHFRYLAIIGVVAFTLTGCQNYVGVQVTGAIGSLELTNNGRDKMTIIEDGFYLFKKGVKVDRPYDVDVVGDSDTSEGHRCEVTGGSNGDGSGNMVNGGVTVTVTCVGV